MLRLGKGRDDLAVSAEHESVEAFWAVDSGDALTGSDCFKCGVDDVEQAAPRCRDDARESALELFLK